MTSFTLTIPPLFNDWKFSIIDSPIGRQCIIDHYNPLSLSGYLLEYYYEQCYHRTYSNYNNDKIQLIRINQQIPADNETDLYIQLGITDTDQNHHKPYIQLELQHPLDISISTINSTNIGNDNRSSSSSSSSSLTSLTTSTTNNAARASRAAARSSLASLSTDKSSSLSTTNTTTATGNKRRRKPTDSTTETTKVNHSIVDLTFDDDTNDNDDHIMFDNIEEHSSNEDKHTSDKDTMEIEDTKFLSRSSSDNISLSKKSSDSNNNHNSTDIQRSSSSSLPLSSTSMDISVSNVSNKPTRLTINQVVEVPPFGYGHIIAVKEIDRITPGPTLSTSVTVGDGDIVISESTKSNIETVCSYTVELWCGIKAYVTSDNPLWKPYCKNISDRTIARYPSWNSRGAVTLNLGDIYRLTPTVYLNDNTIEFYLRYTHTEKLLGYHRSLSHVYGTFFYPLLGNRMRAIQDSWLLDPSKPIPTGTVSIKSIADIDPFSYQFLFIPINDKVHWSTAVVCYPGLLLPGRDGRGKIALLQAGSRSNSSSTTANNSSTLPTVVAAQAIKNNIITNNNTDNLMEEDDSTVTPVTPITSTTVPTNGRRGRKGKQQKTEVSEVTTIEADDNSSSENETSKRLRIEHESSPEKLENTLHLSSNNEEESEESIPMKDNKGKSTSSKTSLVQQSKSKRPTRSSPVKSSINEETSDSDAQSKKRGRRTPQQDTGLIIPPESEDSSAPRRSVRHKNEKDTTTLSSSVDLTVDMTNESNTPSTPVNTDIYKQYSNQVYDLCYSAEEIYSQFRAALCDKLTLSSTSSTTASSFFLPTLEPISSSFLRSTSKSKNSKSTNNNSSITMPNLIVEEYSMSLNKLDDVADNIMKANITVTSETEKKSSASTNQNADNGPKVIGDDLDRELVFDYSKVNIKDTKEYTKHRHILQQQVITAENCMKIKQQDELAVMNRIALETHTQVENARIKSERTVKFADDVGNSSSHMDLTSPDNKETEEIDTFLKKRDRAQTTAYNAAMSAAQIRAGVLSSRIVRNSIGEARKAVKDHIAARARVAHIDAVHFQLLSRTANSFVTITGLRSLLNNAENYLEDTNNLIIEIYKLYESQALASEANPSKSSTTTTKSSKGRKSITSSVSSNTSNAQSIWELLQLIYQLRHHYEYLAGYIADIISSLKARSLSCDQEFRKARDELKALVSEYKTAVNKYNSLEQDLDTEVAVCSAPPTPCIILLDSLKMHRGQEIARRVRFYLEAEFRARYMSPAELTAVHKLQLAQRSNNGRIVPPVEPYVAFTAPSDNTNGSINMSSSDMHIPPPMTTLSSTSSQSGNEEDTNVMYVDEEQNNDLTGENDESQHQTQQTSTRGNDPLSMDFFLSALASAPGNRRKNLKNHTNPTTDAEKVHFAKAIIRRSKLVSATNNTSNPLPPINTNLSINNLEIDTKRSNSPNTIVDVTSPIVSTTTSAKLRGSATSWPWLSSINSLFEASKFPCKQPEHLPRQSNDSDCGVFALQYFESFCIPMLPHVTAEHLASITRMRSIFGDFFDLREVEEKRNAMRSLILNDIAKRAICRPPAPASTLTHSTTSNTTSSTTITSNNNATSITSNTNRNNNTNNKSSRSKIVTLE